MIVDLQFFAKVVMSAILAEGRFMTLGKFGTVVHFHGAYGLVAVTADLVEAQG